MIAPHPDDETLIASGMLRQAVESGEAPAVIVMTNGDYNCVVDGLVREGETIHGLEALGIPENRAYFLGYPDGALARLGENPLPASKRKIDDTCTEGNTTYGARGFRNADYHATRFGTHAVYTRENAVADLAELLRELAPEDVVITHPEDNHPDHAATYALFREAIARVHATPHVHRAIVHNGDCWPMSGKEREPCPDLPIDTRQPMPALTGRLAGYVARERRPVPASCLGSDPVQNRKIRAIAAHASQTRGSWDSYLFSYVRSDELFFPETLSNEQRPSISTDRYRLELDRERQEASLFRDDTRLKTWPLPHDYTSLELSVTPHPDDGVTEISLVSKGRLLGIAVDVLPR